MSKTILALDQSTSATKALLFDESGQLLDKVTRDHQQHYPQPGWVEHDAEEIYQNALMAIRDLLEKHPAHKENLLCLSITNQRETFVVFDRESGTPLYHAIVWQCRRGEPLCRKLIEAGHESQVAKITGLKIDTYFPASKITWLLEAEPEIKKRLISGTALLGTIDTYLIYRLTHGAVFASDHTNACRTLLYDINTLNWHDDLCALFNIPRHALPEIRESAAQFGETDCGGLLSQPISICGVMGDSQAALFAQRCFQAGGAKVTFGTGSSVLLNVGEIPVRSANGIVTTIGWVYDNKPTYAFEGIINFTGATITWMRDQLELISDTQETATLAQSVPDNGGVYLVPAFIGLSAPYWRADVQGAIVGLTPSSTRAHVIRAALESIAYQVRDVLTLMAQDAGVSLQFVQADGGAVSNPFLMQFTADLTRLHIHASTLPELSALGAVFSGLLGMKVYTSFDQLEALPANFDDYQPQMPDEKAERYYAGWETAVKRVL
ncbi:MAG: glycerol kinase GlpK [Aggregatilineales bacterium]